MQASITILALTVSGALESAQSPGASATPAGIRETTPYVQRFAGLFGRES